MELSNYRPESHVAQQSRRDKLRVHQSTQRLHQDYSSNLDQLSIHQGLNPDQIQASDIRYSNISYNPTMISSEMLSFAANPQVLLAQKDAMVVHQESSKVCGDPQNCGPWRSVGSQQNCGWTGNYSVGLTSGIGSHQNSLFVGEGSLSVRMNESLPSPLYTKPTFNSYQDLQSSFTNPTSEISSQNSQKHYEEMHFNSPSFYQNAIPLAVATSGVNRADGLELASIIDQSNPTRIGNSSSWIPRPGESVHHWNGELDFLENKSSRDLRTIASDLNTQGLSLSLSPILPHKTHSGHFGEDLHSGATAFDDHHGPKILKSDYFCSHLKACTTSTKILGNTGPLGPFTGYATILKGSKFLKPAQQLLDVSCRISASKSSNTCEVSKRISNEVKGPSDEALNAAEHIAVTNCNESGVSSSTFYGLNENSGEGVVRCSFSESYQPEYQQKKAKLLFMQEEVSRRYKQYQQQMQMVVSSFETVAGLSSATPYISLALKAVSRHFRCLKNAISDQLKHIRKVLGENFSTPNPGASSSKGDTSSLRLNFFDQNFMKQKSGGGNLGFLGPQQHVWRPQRGLPERSVAILRAWLFEHFLHPYPTDTDKHMLASQTGLSRNQVSNWFINARVRVWKPMVEEIHVLETKGLAEASSNAEGAICRTNPEQPANILSANTSPKLGGDEHNGDQWNQAAEKRSRVEYQIPASTEDTSFMGFMPYQRSGLGLEIGGLGAVSLTLGLRQSVEISAQQQQQFQQQEHQLRQHQQQHFGSQMVHDFVG